MTVSLAIESALDAVIEIGAIPIRFRTTDPEFHRMLCERYADFLAPATAPRCHFDIELIEPDTADADRDLTVEFRGGSWQISRGDFHAEWGPAGSRGRITQSATPYAADSALRIVHSLLLAERGGFLLHAASAIRNGRAFLFAGVSGAGKTTMASLAPSDAILLTDEISYVRPENGRYVAFGTPFTGELNRSGKNVSAPVAALYLLEQAHDNEIASVSPAQACRRLLENILFFAQDSSLVSRVFQTACDFTAAVPVHILRFKKDSSAWDLIA